MNITIARYKLAYDSLCILDPIPVKRETEKSYWSLWRDKSVKI